VICVESNPLSYWMHVDKWSPHCDGYMPGKANLSRMYQWCV